MKAVKEFAVKTPAKKTPAQLAKIAANMAAYNARNAELARLRKFALFCRDSLGYMGPEAVVIAKGQRFAKNCRSLYLYTGTDEEVIGQYIAAVAAVKARQTA